MKKLLGLFVLSLCTWGLAQEQSKPKLVVGIIVDQMRQDYLYRFANDYGNNGFKRLMQQGYNFKNTHFNYMPTYTAPGHTSVYTGATPAIHGIVGNSWYHKSEGQEVYCTTDMRTQSVGIEAENEDGRMSPYRLKSTTITDELKLATNQHAKVIGISIKDRGAILPAGHMADAAYWMDGNGNFISSNFYFDQLPQWVQNYNSQKHADKYINQGWSLARPESDYTESIADDNPYERVFDPKTTPTFPYDLKSIAALQSDKSIIKSTPFGNNMVAELSKEAIRHEQLGKDNTTDFLAISFSSTDYIGHSFAPRSREIQDTYIRLDETLADLFNYLDIEVGKGAYMVFLTADHAAADNPNFLSDLRYDVKNLDRRKIGKEIEAFVEKEFGKDVFVNYSNQNIFLNEDIILEQELDYNAIVQSIQAYVQDKPYVARVYSRKDILRGNHGDYHLSLIQKGYDPKQNGDLVILLDPQYMEYYETGTTHGSTYMYDTHVPLLWYGWHIPQGESVTKKEITQIAPTVSQLLNIAIPNGSQGEVLSELFE